MCFNGPKWKREVVPDHKFDFVDVREFHSQSFGIRLRYVWLYVLVIKNFLVYLSDIFTAVTMLVNKTWSNGIYASCPQTEANGCVFIPFGVAKWLFVGCILFSFLLLAYETRKSKKIIASRDISYAFTNIMANNYYSLRSYDHFCFFCHINDSTKTTDNFAFFIFFTFKDWKRLLLADGPRQGINALTLYAIYLSKRNEGKFWDLSKYTNNSSFITVGLMVSILFTVLIFAGSMILLIAAAVCYVPLLCYIRGNLKEYCCHKVDKRISEIVKRKTKQRLQKQAVLARKEAAGDFSHLRNKKGELIANPLPQPTLPQISLDDDDPKAGAKGQSGDFWGPPDYKSEYSQEYPSDYPPMPMYPYGTQATYASFAPSAPTLHEGSLHEAASDYEYSASQHLTHAAQPIGRSSPHPPSSNSLSNQYSSPVPYEQHQYAEYIPYVAPQREPAPVARPTSGLAYDDDPVEYAAVYEQQQAPPRAPSRNQLQQYRQSPDQSRGYDRGGFAF